MRRFMALSNQPVPSWRKELHNLGFLRATYEGCLYTYEEVDAAGVTQRLDILLHVDDGLYSTTDKELKDRKFRKLRKEIEFTDEPLMKDVYIPMKRWKLLG